MDSLTAKNIWLSGQVTTQWELFKRKFLDLKIKSFQSKIDFSFDFKGYTIKTVNHPSELLEVLKLRHEVFSDTYDVKLPFADIDFDKLDLLGDHVVLIEQNTQKIIGTYRLICSKFSKDFYSENEFQIKNFLNSPGVKLELGRACIHKDYRTGASISLVWRGLAKYALLCGANYLFGCTSVNTISPYISNAVLNYCKREFQSNKYNISPTKKYKYPAFSPLQIVTLEEAKIENYIPSLMKSYLAAGAIVYGEPALDKDFSCTDYFTVLDLENIDPMYYKRYFKPWREQA